jgi:hypothetical protein
MATINRDAKRMGLIDRWQVTIGDDRARDDGGKDDRARAAHSKASSGRMCEG